MKFRLYSVSGYCFCVMCQTVLCQLCSTLVERLFKIQNIGTLSWPARSPDLVPIEYVLDILGRNVRCPHDEH